MRVARHFRRDAGDDAPLGLFFRNRLCGKAIGGNPYR
jgi:hypothetical protein